MAAGGALAALLRRNLVTGATVVVRRDAATAALPVPEGWIHDEWIAVTCALGGGVRLLPEPTIDYRQHGANQIGVRRLTLRQKVARLLEDDSEHREVLRTRRGHRDEFTTHRSTPLLLELRGGTLRRVWQCVATSPFT